MVAFNNSLVFQGSGGQKSKVIRPPLEAPGKDHVLLFQLLGAVSSPWLVAWPPLLCLPFHISQISLCLSLVKTPVI